MGKALAFLHFTFHLLRFTVSERDVVSILLLAVGWTEEQNVESDRDPQQHRPYEQPLIPCHVQARPLSLQHLSKSNAAAFANG